jgi:hypothetical protein
MPNPILLVLAVIVGVPVGFFGMAVLARVFVEIVGWANDAVDRLWERMFR